MEWVFGIGVVFIVLVIFSVKAENKKNKIKLEQGNAYSADIEAARVRIHSQNMTTAASAHADRKTLGHLS